MSTKIFYVHGLGGGVMSSTYIGLCKHFDDVEILQYPSESATYGKNLDIICKKFFEVLERDAPDKIVVVGSSLGGFFSSKLVDEYVRRGCDVNKLGVVLVNPASYPFEVAVVREYPAELVNSYDNIMISQNPNVKKVVVLTEDDEVLDAFKTAERMKENGEIVMFKNGKHSCYEALENDIIGFVKRFC